LTTIGSQAKIQTENHPHLPKNEDGSGSRWVQYRPHIRPANGRF
jgi:hypothetical protein